ncbi:DUF2909 domain-containing protein [Pelomonas sp. CA6]|uniref:DUF2909 domain-containing protein n=1 Tax=Pelomonas sp. CA6 TaxID=2907999 RepID=UPI001F4C2C0F|nr:DUF2909 domain-containing protein [Pelomonas sp. CA6]MCH7344374.1 DUF2909 domain-containing protein [Pelomonas sp. CA6]
MKILMILALLAILGALAAAGLFMLKRGSRQGHMARALGLRVALSIALFLFVLLSYWMGWIKPSGIPVGQ